mmetsp:Transcript_38345/g.98036  ORF Transcript_38345/g.98036 Transcript_38345/m.98036 type:complete len:391 (+) Transcript_38345:275-1447(+)
MSQDVPPQSMSQPAEAAAAPGPPSNAEQPHLARSTSDKADPQKAAKDHAAMIKSAAGELDMESDHFYMYIYKVAPCLKNYTHDWSACPFAHKGEKATRRDPLKFSYMASNCPDFKRGMCPRGDNCSFAHGVFESCLHPERYRTQMCNSGTNCNRSVCFFAHTMAELRSPYCQNAPSQIDATTVASLRALLGRNASPQNGAPADLMQQQHQQQQHHQQQQYQQTEAMLRNALSSLSNMGQMQQHAGWNPAAAMGGQSSMPAGDILNQACNLLCTLHLLSGADQTTARQNALDAFKVNPAAAQASLFNGLSGLQQNGLLYGGSGVGDWQNFNSGDGGLSMLLNAASTARAEPDQGMQPKPYNFLGRDDGLSNMPFHSLQQQQQQQQPFSFLT